MEIIIRGKVRVTIFTMKRISDLLQLYNSEKVALELHIQVSPFLLNDITGNHNLVELLG